MSSSTFDRWLHNPATGEVVCFHPIRGQTLEGDLWLQPGAAVASAHIHDRLVERFEVLAGEVGLQVGRERRLVCAGDAVIEVPAHTLHDWWNAGDGIAHVRLEVVGEPVARFIEMIEVVFALGALERVNAKGMPDALWLSAIAREYRDVIRLPSPAAALLSLLAGLSRLAGRDPRAPGLHGPDAPCAIPAPSVDELARLLGRPVGTSAARGH